MASDWPVSTWTAAGGGAIQPAAERAGSEVRQRGVVCDILSLVRYVPEVYQSSMPPPIGYSKYITAD